ncbi:MAG TPA: low temperature requirement protein A [Actinomycetes bacterium]|nr:low temperature requirement protein A [Actinomycetes bacterium]
MADTDHTAEEHVHEPPDDEYTVSPLELFFDLVFVFAFTQVTDLLAHDLTWTGLVRGTALLLVVWWSWVGYSWLTNAVRVDDIIPARIVVFAAMGAGLVMALAIPHAFDTDGVLFGCSVFAVTALFVLLYFVATKDRPEMHRAVVLLAPGVLGGPVLLIIAGFLEPSPLRAILWGVALAMTLGAPFVSGTQGWYVRPAHFAERHGLIIIIALGESLVALGLSASEEQQTFTTVTASLMGLALVACLWWIYFDVVSRAAELALSRLTGAARNAMARDVYSYIHFFMVLGIVLVALGLKKALLGVDEPLYLVASVGLFGGTALYLLGHMAARLRLIGGVNPWRLALVIVLVCLIPVGTQIPAYASVSLLLVLLIAGIGQALYSYREQRHRVRYHSH